MCINQIPLKGHVWRANLITKTMLSRSLGIIALSSGAVLIALPLDAQKHDSQQTARRRGATVSVGATTRMLRIAPHPDDEGLAAGGLLRHLRAARGALRV